MDKVLYKYSNFKINGIRSSKEECEQILGHSFYRLIREHASRQAIKLRNDLVTYSVHIINYMYYVDGQIFPSAQKALDYVYQHSGIHRKAHLVSFNSKNELNLGDYKIIKCQKLTNKQPTNKEPYVMCVAQVERNSRIALSAVGVVYEKHTVKGVDMVLKKYSSNGLLVKTYGMSEGAKYLQA